MKTPYVLALSALLLGACAQTPDVPVEDVPQTSAEEVVFAPLAFTLPEGWVAESQMNGYTITVPDSKYEVSLDMYLQSSSPLGDQDLSSYTSNDEGITLYYECGGGICFQVAYEGTNYFFGMDVNSTEPVPENLDGIWTPTFDAAADLKAFEESVHLAK